MDGFVLGGKARFHTVVGVFTLLGFWFLVAAGEAASPGLALATLDIKDAIVQPARGESKGTLTVAQHFGLSPTWFDPQEQGVGGIAQAFAALVHDAMIKPTGQGFYTYSLAEHLEMPADYTYARFRLRAGLKFHDGTPLTTADVKWNYENYRGFHASVLHDKLEKSRADGGIEIVDERTNRLPLQRTLHRLPGVLQWHAHWHWLDRAQGLLSEGRPQGF